ncbi:unnamed protein product, partial [Rotaria sordida]
LAVVHHFGKALDENCSSYLAKTDITGIVVLDTPHQKFRELTKLTDLQLMLNKEDFK